MNFKANISQLNALLANFLVPAAVVVLVFVVKLIHPFPHPPPRRLNNANPKMLNAKSTIQEKSVAKVWFVMANVLHFKFQLLH